MTCNLDGSEYESLIKTGDWQTEKDATNQLKWFVGISVDTKRGRFYWTQKGISKGAKGGISGPVVLEDRRPIHSGRTPLVPGEDISIFRYVLVKALAAATSHSPQISKCRSVKTRLTVRKSSYYCLEFPSQFTWRLRRILRLYSGGNVEIPNEVTV
jgi:hypothetical protein